MTPTTSGTPPVASGRHVQAMALAYGTAYMVPALWPFFLGPTYRYAIIACNMADTAGRSITAHEISVRAVVAATALLSLISLVAPFCAQTPRGQWLYTMTAAAAF